MKFATQMKKDSTITVRNLYKSFKLPHEKHSGIKQNLINIFNTKRGYETQHVLNDISFDIKKGEFFGIVGRNGSGKSTLLKLLAGIYASDSGSVRVNGSLTPFIELGVGFNPELTGKENVFMNGALLGFDRKEIEGMYKDVVDFAELENFMDQKLKNYSSGMQIRLAFSIAIQAKSDILLLDEVLAVGDVNFQNKCSDYFERTKGKKTIILVSHDMNAIKKYCDRALLLEGGKIIDIDRSEIIALRYGAIMSNSEMKISKEAKSDGVHIGSREVSIDSVELLNNKGENSTVIMPDSPFSIRTSYSTDKKNISYVSFLVSVLSTEGFKIFSATTRTDNINANIHGKDGEFTLKLSKNLFPPGRYRVNIGIFDHTTTIAFDHFRDALIFNVAGERKVDSNMSVPYVWEINDGK